jgi:hypothetical protein
MQEHQGEVEAGEAGVTTRRAAIWLVVLSYAAVTFASLTFLRAPAGAAIAGFSVWLTTLFAALWVNWRVGVYALPTAAIVLYWILAVDALVRSCNAGDCL